MFPVSCNTADVTLSNSDLQKREAISMFNFFKNYIIYVAVVFVILESTSCIINAIGKECLFGFLLSFVSASLFFFLECKVFNKGCISDKTVLVLLGIGLLGTFFCVLSFLKKNSGYTYIIVS